LSFAVPETRVSGNPLTPQFAKPPVIEVAISVQFEELRRFNVVHFGLLWERWRDRFPDTQHQPPLAPVVELFGKRRARIDEVRVESAFPVGRCWYRSKDRGRLIQVQPDRFVLNWQKVDDETRYPSYEALRGEFESELGVFLAFVAENGLGEFEPTQCELIYVNHLVSGHEWTRPQDLTNVLVPLAERVPGDSALPEVEDVRLAWQYRFEADEVPLGRLHVLLNSGEREKDGYPVFVMQLIGRGAPRSPGVPGVLEFTDTAHQWITESFAAITTERMHHLWERER
jgi:uncharacterized protein (TIGR04255 family)